MDIFFNEFCGSVSNPKLLATIGDFGSYFKILLATSDFLQEKLPFYQPVCISTHSTAFWKSL